MDLSPSDLVPVIFLLRLMVADALPYRPDVWNLAPLDSIVARLASFQEG